jgi:dCTP deaminase
MSTLNRRMIENLATAGKLIKEGFCDKNIREACYEASTSNDFFEISETGARKINIADGNHYILRPNTQVVCVTKEYFDIPLDNIARILLLGHFFSLGVAPVNTYADPGFKGRLGIVLSNTSRNYLKIGTNERIAKIEFATMLEACAEGYTGQHGGDVSTWPFRADMIADKPFLLQSGIDPNSPTEIERIYGPDLKNVIFGIRKFSWQLGIATLLSSVLPVIAIWGIKEQWNFSSPILILAIGIITGVVSNWIFHCAVKGLSN